MSVREQWARIEMWLEANRPDLLDELNPPASEGELALLAEDGVPEGWLELYRIHNGGAPVFFDWDWVPIDPDGPHSDSVQDEWELMARLVEETGDWDPPDVEGPVRAVWASERWLPIAVDHSGCSLCIDLDPDEGGHVGQLIEVEDDRRRVLHQDATSFLRWLADGLESGDIHLSSAEDELAMPAAITAQPELLAPVPPAPEPPAPEQPPLRSAVPVASGLGDGVPFTAGPVDRTRELRVDGADLHATVALTPEEAATGLHVEIVGPEGPVAVALPAGAGHGARLRMAGLGQGGQGDLVLQVVLELPKGWEPDPRGRCRELSFDRWDVLVEVELRPEELEGATVPVATHAGVVQVVVPAGATEVRVQESGLSRPSGVRGDLVVLLR